MSYNVVMNICLIGRTGSGKTTLAQKMASEFNLEIICSNMLRGYVKQRLDRYQEVEKCMSLGETVPFEIYELCLQNKIASTKNKSGFILENIYPRADCLKIVERNLENTKFIYLDISEEKANERSSVRSRDDLSSEFLENREKVFSSLDKFLSLLTAESLFVVDASLSESELFNIVKSWIQVNLTKVIDETEKSYT